MPVSTRIAGLLNTMGQMMSFQTFINYWITTLGVAGESGLSLRRPRGRQDDKDHRHTRLWPRTMEFSWELLCGASNAHVVANGETPVA